MSLDFQARLAAQKPLEAGKAWHTLAAVALHSLMDTQVAIIGGGPAGAVCAAELARRSIDVVVVESRPFPRMKTCGEFLSPPGVAILNELLGPQTLRDAGARTIERIAIWGRGRRLLDWPIAPAPGGPISSGRGWSLSRQTLDTLLLQQAAAAGACVLQPQVVRTVVYEEQRVRLDLGDRELTANCVIHADGSGRHDPAGAVPSRRGVVAAKAHFRLPGALSDTLQLHGFALPAGTRQRSRTGRGYFGLVEVEGGLATLAMVVDQALVRALAGDFDVLLQQSWPDAAHARRVSSWHCCPVAGSGYIAPGHPRSFRIGNAAAAVEPVGGEGIGLALWAGSLLGRRLALDHLPQTQRLLAPAYRRRLRLRRPICRLMAEMLMHPGLLAGLARPLSVRPGLAIGPLYRWSGKMDPA